MASDQGGVTKNVFKFLVGCSLRFFSVRNHNGWKKSNLEKVKLRNY
jgi:hypothetical protein